MSISDVDPVKLAQLPAREREELEQMLGLLKGSYERNPLEAYRPHPKQVSFHEAKQRTRMFCAGSRTGKSTCGTVDDLVQALPVTLVPQHLLPYKKFGFERRFKGRVITPDLGHTMDVILEKFRELCPKEALRGGDWDSAFDKTRRVLRFERGDVLDFMSFEQGKDKFGGVALHRVHFDEEPQGPNSWPIYRDCRMRLIDHGGDMIFTMTPLAQTDWVQEAIWEKRGSDRVFGIQASMRDNPYLSKAEVDEALEGLSKEERAVIELGQFVHFAGLFYDEFDSFVHVREPPTVSEIGDWDVMVGIDPGRRTGVVWCGFDGDNRCFVFDELYPHDELVPTIANQIKAKNEAWGISPAYVIDPAARMRLGPGQEQFNTAFAREDIFASDGQNARGPGIMEVKRRLQQGGLFISSECRNLLWEFPRYRRDPNVDDEWQAVKVNDHCLDALRYAIMERTWAGQTRLTPRRSNYNAYANPKVEPPWRGADHNKPNPPLGIYS